MPIGWRAECLQPNSQETPAMTKRQFNRMVEKTAETHGLSYQLTEAWLRDHGFERLDFSTIAFTRAQVSDLRKFAKL